MLWIEKKTEMPKRWKPGFSRAFLFFIETGNRIFKSNMLKGQTFISIWCSLQDLSAFEKGNNENHDNKQNNDNKHFFSTSLSFHAVYQSFVVIFDIQTADQTTSGRVDWVSPSHRFTHQTRQTVVSWWFWLWCHPIDQIATGSHTNFRCNDVCKAFSDDDSSKSSDNDDMTTTKQQ